MNCLPHIQFEYDLWYVDGGLYNIARGLRRLLDELGVEVRLETEIAEIRKDGAAVTSVEGDAVGLLRLDDCANLDSVCCIQTADLARRVEDGIVVLGRAPGAVPRGCSLAADQALGRP